MFINDKEFSRPSHRPARPNERSDLGRLGLGTVQFGVDYGISNELGQCSLEETGKVLAEAHRLGLRVLDTAPGYGDAEKAIGLGAPATNEFKIVTKTVPVAGSEVNNIDTRKLVDDFEASCRRLNRTSLYGILVHHADDLLKNGGDRLMAALQQLRTRGRVRKIGVSVYNAAQIDALLDRYDIDLVQLPVNVFDQRLIRSGHLAKLKDRGIEIHARSVFLQGLLLMSFEKIPADFDTVLPHIRDYHFELKTRGISKTEAALSFARSVEEIDVILVGVASVEQLLQNVKAYQSQHELDFRSFALDDVSILDPQQWKSS